MKCPCCEGVGEIFDDYVADTRIYYDCEYCGAEGSVPLWKWLQWKWWDVKYWWWRVTWRLRNR